ncbi:MAG: erythromycin biosynthesis sensory transduction protein eryC1 [Planctomycetaceae bacterium]|nr:erythromycin biosynthesis sensory transduction protein eryC1 [Planctomycetaceae bacterium]
MSHRAHRIPILDLSPETDALWDQLEEATQRVMRSDRFILGPEVQAFEQEAADYLGVEHALGCNSGTDALIMSLRALGVAPGDEVVTTSFTFFATAEAISIVGAKPVFVDIEPASLNIDPAALEEAITENTKAVVVVHLFGHAAEMDAIRDIAQKHGLKILEDAAQAFGGGYRGTKLGSIGDAGAFSFFPSKNLGAFGDGGLVTTNDSQVADTVRLLRGHGSIRRYENEVLGYNSRLDEMQAAILRVKLPHIDRWNEGRRRAAQRYNELLADTPWIETPTAHQDAYHVYHQYTVRIRGGRRDEIVARLDDAGISSMVYYPVPVHALPVYADEVHAELPVTMLAAAEVLSLPIGPSLPEDSILRIVEALKSCGHSAAA